jgi:hypothetical protein
MTKSSETRIAHGLGSCLMLISKAMEAGIPGGLRFLGELLRGQGAKPFLKTLAEQASKEIDPGRLAAPETHSALAEVVDDLEKEVPDQRRIDILRRAFLGIAKGDPEDPNGVMGLIYLKTARKLTGEQAAVLGSAFRHRDDYRDRSTNIDCVAEWEPAAMKETGIRLVDPLRTCYVGLVALGLFRPLNDAKQPVWKRTSGGPVTEYGIAFCEFLGRVEPLEPSSG